MPKQILSDSDPERWTLRRALREKKGWSDTEIEQLKESDVLDRVELAMSLEGEFGIQIADEEFQETGDDTENESKS